MSMRIAPPAAIEEARNAPVPRLLTWIGQACRGLRWRHALAWLLVSLAFDLGNPGGGTIFQPPGDGVAPPLVRVVMFGLFGAVIVFCVLVADRAADTGVRPVRAYLVATVTAAITSPFLVLEVMARAGWFELPLNQKLWWGGAVLLQGGLGIAIHAYLREARRALERVRNAEAERTRDERRLAVARLLALQSRVDPQLLFDALTHVVGVHKGDPQAADALLAELIVLLRAMLPSAERLSSTVEREFAIVQAYVNVGDWIAGSRPNRVLNCVATAGTATARLPPMLVLPMLRDAFGIPGAAAAAEWTLHSQAADGRLRIALDVPVGVHLADINLAPLRERLQQSCGDSARAIAASGGGAALPGSIVLDMPLEMDAATDAGV